MRLAQIKDGVVINVIEADPDNLPDWADGWPKAEQAGSGWSYDGKTFAPPPEPDPEPVEEPPSVQQLQAAIEAVAKAAGVSDNVLQEAGLVRRAEIAPVVGGKK